MRVLHLGAGNIYGGIERALVSYAAERNACQEMAPEFALCFAGQLEAELKAEGVQVFVLGSARLSKWTSIAKTRRALALLLRERSPDIVITHGPWIHCVLGPVVRRAKIPLAVFFHSPPSLHWLDLLARTTQPTLAIANSRFTLEKARWWTRGTQTVVCTYPFKFSKERSRERARSKLGIPSTTVLIVQASRLDPYKGHRLHLEALSRLERDGKWQALFVGAVQPGKEKYAQSLERLRDHLGLSSHVQFTGHRTDVEEIMAAADLFCHPNVEPEAFGLVFVEAMLAGIPVVATDMGGAREILSQGGGVLVAPKPEPLALALKGLIMDRERREAVGRVGRQLAHGRYSSERAMRELAQVLERVARKNFRAGWSH